MSDGSSSFRRVPQLRAVSIVANSSAVEAITLPEMQRRVSEGDSALVSKLASGDEEAFRALYDRYADAVYNHCLRLAGSAAAAEDLAAVVFLESWRRRSDFRIVEGSAAPWLHGIAYNAARNFWRASRRYRSALARLAETRVVSDPTVGLIDRIAAEQTIRQLLPAIQALPSQERQAIELCIAAGMTHQEAASLLGVPIGTVKSRLSRGLTKLRSSLDLQLAEEEDA